MFGDLDWTTYNIHTMASSTFRQPGSVTPPVTRGHTIFQSATRTRTRKFLNTGIWGAGTGSRHCRWLDGWMIVEVSFCVSRRNLLKENFVYGAYAPASLSWRGHVPPILTAGVRGGGHYTSRHSISVPHVVALCLNECTYIQILSAPARPSLQSFVPHRRYKIKPPGPNLERSRRLLVNSG